MSTKKIISCVTASLLLTGCITDNALFATTDPSQTQAAEAFRPAPRTLPPPPEVITPASDQASAWVGGPADLFRDARARAVGDLLVVRVSLNDNANFATTSDGEAKSSFQGSSDHSINLFGFGASGQTSANTSMNSATTGQGSVTRSEQLNIQISATVRYVMPNGMLAVEGTQEILVNSEKRLVKLSGVVDPRYIAPDNSIDYSKIADARIAYGGSGEITKQQSSRWGTQLWDKIKPF